MAESEWQINFYINRYQGSARLSVSPRSRPETRRDSRLSLVSRTFLVSVSVSSSAKNSSPSLVLSRSRILLIPESRSRLKITVWSRAPYCYLLVYRVVGEKIQHKIHLPIIKYRYVSANMKKTEQRTLSHYKIVEK